MDSNCIIRKATKTDVADILRLTKELAQHHDMEHEVTIDLDEFIRLGFGGNPIWWAFVAEFDGKIVGFALYFIRFATFKGQTLYLEDFFVSDEVRSKGIGKLLFDALIAEAKSQNMVAMNWQMMKWNSRAKAFYSSYGAEFDEERLWCSLSLEQ